MPFISIIALIISINFTIFASDDYDELIDVSKFYNFTIDYSSTNNIGSKVLICKIKNQDSKYLRRLKVNSPDKFKEKEVYVTNKKIYSEIAFLHYGDRFVAKTTNNHILYKSFNSFIILKNNKLITYNYESKNNKSIEYSCKEPSGFQKIKMFTKLKVYEGDELLGEHNLK